MSGHDLAVFAGGEGRRIGGGKPSLLLGGEPLLVVILRRHAPAARRVAVAVRDEAAGQRLIGLVRAYLPQLSVEVWVDAAGVEGPVAALLGAAAAASAPRLLTMPVDTPFLPANLGVRLAAGLSGGACAAMAADREDHGDHPGRDHVAADVAAGATGALEARSARSLRLHPTVALFDRTALAALAPRRSLQDTIEPLRPVPIELPSADLFNINTRDQLAMAERQLGQSALRHEATSE